MDERCTLLGGTISFVALLYGGVIAGFVLLGVMYLLLAVPNVCHERFQLLFGTDIRGHCVSFDLGAVIGAINVAILQSYPPV